MLLEEECMLSFTVCDYLIDNTVIYLFWLGRKTKEVNIIMLGEIRRFFIFQRVAKPNFRNTFRLNTTLY